MPSLPAASWRPGGWWARMSAAASSAWRSIGSNHSLSPGSWVSSVAMISLSFADVVLGVVALEEPAAADGHQPRAGIGEVAHRPGALLRGGPALPRCRRGPG